MIVIPRRGGRHYTLVIGAEEAMQAFRMEIAKELGLADKIEKDGSFKKMTTVEVGQIGGEMVRRIQAAGEFAIMQRYKKGEKRLMPSGIMPNENEVRHGILYNNDTVNINNPTSDNDVLM